jgi:hypothetical protein
MVKDYQPSNLHCGCAYRDCIPNLSWKFFGPKFAHFGVKFGIHVFPVHLFFYAFCHCPLGRGATRPVLVGIRIHVPVLKLVRFLQLIAFFQLFGGSIALINPHPDLRDCLLILLYLCQMYFFFINLQ